MKNIKNLVQYTPDIPVFSVNALYLKDVQGRDWYESQKEFKGSDETMKVVYDRNGLIWSISTDVSKLWPINMSVGEVPLDKVPEGMSDDGKWQYVDGDIVPRTYTKKQYTDEAETQKQTLIGAANRKTQALQVQLMLGMISDTDKQTLTKWMEYVQKVQAVDVNNAPDIKWPAEPM